MMSVPEVRANQTGGTCRYIKLLAQGQLSCCGMGFGSTRLGLFPRKDFFFLLQHSLFLRHYATWIMVWTDDGGDGQALRRRSSFVVQGRYGMVSVQEHEMCRNRNRWLCRVLERILWVRDKFALNKLGFLWPLHNILSILWIHYGVIQFRKKK